MSSMKPEIIRYHYVDNMGDIGERLNMMGAKLFGDDFKGFIKETTWIHSDGFITKKIEPISGTPAQGFRKAIEDAGLVGYEF